MQMLELQTLRPYGLGAGRKGGKKNWLAWLERESFVLWSAPLQAGDLEASDSRALAPGTSFESLLLLEVLIDNLKGSAIVCPKGS